MIKRHIWTIWTPMSSVLKKVDRLNLSLSLLKWSIFAESGLSRSNCLRLLGTCWMLHWCFGVTGLVFCWWNTGRQEVFQCTLSISGLFFSKVLPIVTPYHGLTGKVWSVFCELNSMMDAFFSYLERYIMVCKIALYWEYSISKVSHLV